MCVRARASQHERENEKKKKTNDMIWINTIDLFTEHNFEHQQQTNNQTQLTFTSPK